MYLIILWMFGFAVIHSLTADKHIKAATERLIGERARHGLYRLFYNILSMILLLPLLLFIVQNGTVIWQVPGFGALFFIGIQLIGVSGVLVSVMQIDGGRFLGTKQLTAYLKGEPLPLPDEPLVISGVYGLVRHPLYLFSMLAIWFTPVMTDTLLVFNICVSLYFLIGSRIEEGRMLRAYGEAYETYRQRVPWMIPSQESINIFKL